MGETEYFSGNASWTDIAARTPVGESAGDAARRIHEGMAVYVETPSGRLTEEVELGIDLMHARLPRLPYDFGGTSTLCPT